MTQEQKLLRYMKNHGAVDNLIAWRECGVYALSQRLGDLRRQGVKMIARWKRVRTKGGEESRVKEWRLAR